MFEFPLQCFRRPYPGAALHRYFIGRFSYASGFFIVHHTQVSRPEHELIAEPARVLIATAKPAPRSRPARKLRDTSFLLPGPKRCAACAQVKPSTEFYTREASGRQNRHAYCKPCHLERSRARRAPRPTAHSGAA